MAEPGATTSFGLPSRARTQSTVLVRGTPVQQSTAFDKEEWEKGHSAQSDLKSAHYAYRPSIVVLIVPVRQAVVGFPVHALRLRWQVIAGSLRIQPLNDPCHAAVARDDRDSTCEV
jgi:hypothetical protein